MNLSLRRHIGIDYSGAQTATSSLQGLRVYEADQANEPEEIAPPLGSAKYWTRRGANPQATSATSFLLLTNEITNHRLMYPKSTNANVV